MGYEVEMKAWVDDWQAVEAHLRATCVLERGFEKSDRYYRCDGRDGGSEVPGQMFRVRADDGRATVTFKEKRLADGVEFNREREFGVDDPGAFLELVERVGCREVFAKKKRGLHFHRDGLVVELCHVEGLGDFLEVEWLHEHDDETAHGEAAGRIRELIRGAGISDERIEERPYMKMLREARGEG